MALTQIGNDFVERAKEIVMQLDALEASCMASAEDSFKPELHLASLTYRVVHTEVANLIRKYKGQDFLIDMINAMGTKLLDTVAENKAEIENKVPLRRLGDPSELAAAVAFMAGDDASWITGQTLFVSGGYRMP